MTECRPNNIFFDLIHKSLTDSMDLLEIAKKNFVSCSCVHQKKNFSSDTGSLADIQIIEPHKYIYIIKRIKLASRTLLYA